MNGVRDFGKMALGSRLRILSDTLTENAKSILALYDVPLKPRSFPVFYVVSRQEALSIGTIAKKIRHSHPSVIKIVKQLKKEGILDTQQDEKDARRTNVIMTPLGKRIAGKIETQYEDVTSAIEEILDSQTHDLWKALDELEFLLSEKTMFRRVLEKKKQRESNAIEVVQYSNKYKKAFKELNIEWIEKFFKIEDADLKVLDNPKENILQKGGKILVALYEKRVAGVCALIKLENEHYDFELAKMAVAPEFKGKGIGYALGRASVEEARILGARNLYLESNTTLKPAISLYKKLGFEKIQGLSSPYERCNIQMVLRLN